MIAGIDGAGTIETSSHPDWKPGDKVILSTAGTLRRNPSLALYAEKARVKSGDWLVLRIAAEHERHAMRWPSAPRATRRSFGNGAGRHGIRPGDGPVIVT